MLLNMKAVLLCVLVICAITASSTACENCPPHRNPQCGFNGSCLYEFNNPCELTRYNCQKGGYFRQTSSYQCESAKKGTNRYNYCHNSGGYLW